MVSFLVSCGSLRSRFHIVQSWDTPQTISRQYEIPLSSLIQANPHSEFTKLVPGTKLYVPFEENQSFEYSPKIERSGNKDHRFIFEPHFIWPLIGSLSSEFGHRSGKIHEGIDIVAPRGSPVKAARSGHVIYASDRIGGYGNMIILRHGDSFATVYAHLQRIRVKKGAFIQKGRVIGHVGKTGRATDYHLHFEIRNYRRPINPLLYLRSYQALNIDKGETRRVETKSMYSKRSPMEILRSCVRDIPDFPKSGILFKDITPLLQNAEAFQLAIEQMGTKLKDIRVDKVVAIESRGFIFGSALAYKYKAGLSIVRKPKKLPYKTVRVDYDLEYGKDALEMHVDSLRLGENIVMVDDVLATGGTARATAELVKKMGGRVQACVFFLELEFLKGREKLEGYRVETLLKY